MIFMGRRRGVSRIVAFSLLLLLLGPDPVFRRLTWFLQMAVWDMVQADLSNDQGIDLSSMIPETYQEWVTYRETGAWRPDPIKSQEPWGTEIMAEDSHGFPTIRPHGRGDG